MRELHYSNYVGTMQIEAYAKRPRRKLTQSDLAARLQIEGIIMERDSISRIEIGTRFVADYELKVLAKILGVEVNWLLGIQ